MLSNRLVDHMVLEGGAANSTNPAQRAQLALDAGKMGCFEWHMDTGEVDCDRRLREHFGLRMDGTLMVEDFFAVIHPDDVPVVDAQVNRAIKETVDYDAEWRVILPGGKIRWLGARGRIIAFDQDGTPLRMLGLNWDITEQKEQQQRLSLMAREMNHRVKNIFAMIAALIRMAKTRTTDVSSFADVLRSQVFALSDAHALTMEYANASSKDAAIPAQRIVEGALAAWTREECDIPIDIDVSRAIMLDARQTSALAMMLYELATNAAKYGALISGEGSLKIALLMEPGGRAKLTWREVLTRRTLDPTRTSAAQDTGFGAVLMRQSALSLNGSLEQVVHPNGVEVSLNFPLA